MSFGSSCAVIASTPFCPDVARHASITLFLLHVECRRSISPDVQLHILDSLVLFAPSARGLRACAGNDHQDQPGTFTSSGTAASYLELCSTSEVLTLRTCGAAVRWVTKS